MLNFKNFRIFHLLFIMITNSISKYFTPQSIAKKKQKESPQQTDSYNLTEMEKASHQKEIFFLYLLEMA